MIPYDLFRLMCVRRGAQFRSVNNIGMTLPVKFGLPTNTFILPVTVNAFYFFDYLTIAASPTMAGFPQLFLSNYGGGSAGEHNILPATGTTGNNHNGVINMTRFETDFLEYRVNNHTAGDFSLYGLCYKIFHS